MVPIGAGGNSRIYRIETADGSHLALKWYFRDEQDNRDRLDVEFRALQFLSAHGIESVPRPVAANPTAGIGIYELIEGEPALAGAIGVGDIVAALAFAGQLRDLSREPDTDALPTASEACFCLRDVEANLEHRAACLGRASVDTDAERALRRFFDDELYPTMRATIERSADQLLRAGIAVDVALGTEFRTLSPSDFGFHNAIRRNGSLVFVDFEYFGWDDPAKLLCDFLLHPAMPLSEPLKKQVTRGVLRDFRHDPGLPVRVAAFYPLFALKWCLIVLNEFLPDQLRRRRFAAEPLANVHEVQMRQLGKARRMLAAATAPILM